jgi:hypothetical protein
MNSRTTLLERFIAASVSFVVALALDKFSRRQRKAGGPVFQSVRGCSNNGDDVFLVAGRSCFQADRLSAAGEMRGESLRERSEAAARDVTAAGVGRRPARLARRGIAAEETCPRRRSAAPAAVAAR